MDHELVNAFYDSLYMMVEDFQDEVDSAVSELNDDELELLRSHLSESVEETNPLWKYLSGGLRKQRI